MSTAADERTLPVLRVERALGNRHTDPDLAAACSQAERSGELVQVHLSFDEARRSRLRTRADDGTEVGISLSRGSALRDGDVVHLSPDGGRVVVTVVHGGAEALVIRRSPEPGQPVGTGKGEEASEGFELGVRLGHALGNRHWPLRMEHGCVLVPVTIGRRAMETVLGSQGLDGLEWDVVEVEPERLPAAMAPVAHALDEAAHLAGAAPAPPPPSAPPEPSGRPFTLLCALQLGDSFFPSGLYTLSHGLESFIQQGWVRSGDDLEALIDDYVSATVGVADAVAAAGAARAAASGDVDQIVGIDRLLHSTKLAHEAAASSVRTGRRLLAVAGCLSDDPTLGRYAQEVSAERAPGNYAVALGVFGAVWGLGPTDVVLVELYSFVTGVLGAALRLLRLDHVQTQAILHRLAPRMAHLAAKAAETDPYDLRPFAPAIEIMQMRHERAHVRLFAS